MTPEPSAWKDVLEALKVGGPWTFLLAAAWVIRYLYQSIEKLREKHA